MKLGGSLLGPWEDPAPQQQLADLAVAQRHSCRWVEGEIVFPKIPTTKIVLECATDTTGTYL